jgi:anthranilate phosphoribosyltransferase
LRHAAGPRVELGTRTIFNLLGPMANPARVKRQLTGVFDPAWCVPMAEALRNLGSTDAWIVHGQGLDELTLAGENHVTALKDGRIDSFLLTPEDAGLTRAPISAIVGGEPDANASALRALLAGQVSAYRDTVLLNAGAGLVVAGRAANIIDGIAQATTSIDSGAANAALDALIRETA